MPDLLLELFSEEIPGVMQAQASADLKRMVTERVVDAGLTYASAGAFATPRRLTLTIEGLLSESPTLRQERRGPRVDAPQKALEGFLRSQGLTQSDVTQRTEKKGTFWVATVTTPGRPAEQILAQVIPEVIQGFPWPKSMRWANGSLRWVRPLQNILCLLTDEAEPRVVPFELGGYTSNAMTQGHRFMAPGVFSVTSFEDYTTQLKRHFVILDPQERADLIWAEAENRAFASGLEVIRDPALLAEVAGLVEWPVVLMGTIGTEFLDLPPEVLQTSMREHQKFFSVKDKDGKVVRFITVANRETVDHGATILSGNTKVLSARLADAKFFWDNDVREAKTGMKIWAQSLEKVIFHRRLGTQSDRIARLVVLAQTIAPKIGADPDLAQQAAKVVKLDLSSEMVYEFPELQGVMGRYYSVISGYPPEVSEACQAHYAPLGPSDDVPSAPVSVTVALVDKLDLLTGFWAIDEKPTGSKDPFSLRRAALGIIRLILENDINLPLLDLFRVGRDLHLSSLDQEADTEESDLNLLSFIHDRLKVYLRDRGFAHDVIEACLSVPQNDNLLLLVKRITALQAVLQTEDGENLVQGYKRAANILAQAEAKDGVEYSFGADRKFADTPEEGALFDALAAADVTITAALATEDFSAAMAAMATLRGPIDAFFEAVQVNADNQILRRNRLNLLSRIRSICDQVAALDRLQG